MQTADRQIMKFSIHYLAQGDSLQAVNLCVDGKTQSVGHDVAGYPESDVSPL